eukprot:Rmarinus@m.10155
MVGGKWPALLFLHLGITVYGSCITGSVQCNENATCTRGSGCVCKDGYYGDGVDYCLQCGLYMISGHDAVSCICEDGFAGSQDVGCRPCGAHMISVNDNTECVCSENYYYSRESGCLSCGFNLVSGQNSTNRNDCVCKAGYYGTWAAGCSPCEGHASSEEGSLSPDDCYCTDLYERDPITGKCIEACPDEESYQFAVSFADPGTFSSAGCEFGGTYSRECCLFLRNLVQHPCYAYALDVLRSPISGPYFAFIAHANYTCGVAGAEECGNGILEGWERCDDYDENNEHGYDDGCSDCFVESGYVCSNEPDETSECRKCKDDCESLHRHPCLQTGEPCGVCLEGYVEVENGACGRVWEVLYVAVNTHMYDTIPGSCEYEPLGTVVDPDEIATPTRYIEHVETVHHNRTVGERVKCWLADAVSQAPTSAGRVIVVEVLKGFLAVTDSISYGEAAAESFFVVYRAGPDPLVLKGAGPSNPHHVFDVFPECTLLVYNVRVKGVSGTEGAVVRNYGGRVVLQHSFVEEYTPFEFAGSYYDWRCEGALISNAGVMILRDVQFSLNSVDILESYESRCMVQRGTAISSLGRLEMTDVVVIGDVASDSYFHFAAPSVLTNVTFIGVTTFHGSLVYSEIDLVVRGLRVEDSRVGTSVLSLQGTAVVEYFVIAHTEIAYGSRLDPDATDTSSIGALVVSSAALVLRDGIVENNTLSSHLGDVAIRNRNSLVAENVRIVNNTGPVLSVEPFIVRDSVWLAPGAGVRREGRVTAATCTTSLSQAYLPQLYPCGIKATCTDSIPESVHCSCGEYVLGDPTVVCGDLATLEILPSDRIVVYAVKKEDEPYPTQDVRFVADGLGTVRWHVESSSLPPWLAIMPSSGAFESNGVCAYGMDVRLFFDLGPLSGLNRQSSAVVMLTVESNFTDPIQGAVSTSMYRPLYVDIDAEIPASNDTSTAHFFGPCSGESCSVEAGSRVVIFVELRDWVGLGLLVGGDTSLSALSSTIVTFEKVDHGNGSYGLEFDAPHEEFTVDVFLLSSASQRLPLVNSPLYFTVWCPEGQTQSGSDSPKCVDERFQPPKLIVALSVVASFVLLSAALRIVRRKNISFSTELLKDETTRIAMSGCMEVLDLGTDIGATVTVLTTERLKAYAPYYAVCIALAVCVSSYRLYTLVLAIRTIVQEKLFHKLQSGRKPLAKPIYLTKVVNDLSVLLYEDDVDAVLARLSRTLRGHLIAVLVLVVEDLPMQALNIIVLCVSMRNRAEPVLLVSTLVTCVLIGYKASKAVEAFRTFRYIGRIRRKSGRI